MADCAVVPDFLARATLAASPFPIIGREGIGQLVDTGVTLGRTTMPKLRIGNCGDHRVRPDVRSDAARALSS